MYELTIEQRVVKGVELLDKEIPDWHKKIDLENLHMDEYYECIVGQLFGEFNTSLIGIDSIDEEISHGFELKTVIKDYEDSTVGQLDWIKETEKLGAVWGSVIKQRLENAKENSNA